jgi:hypothetical protein
MFVNLLSCLSGRSRTSTSKPRRARRPTLESLDERVVLSAFSLGAGLTTPGGVYSPVNASSAKGTSVVAFVDTNSLTNPTNWEIDAQLYNSKTGAAIGAPIYVWSSRYSVSQPTVAMNASGNFVVAWQNLNGSGNGMILGARFTGSGTPLNLLNPFTVANYAGGYSTVPSAAIDQNGNFVVSFTYEGRGSSQSQIYAYKSNWANTQTTTFGVATGSGVSYQQSKIAMAPGGFFQIAYQSSSTVGTAIKLNSYAAGATSAYGVRTYLPIGGSNAIQYDPTLAMDNAGDTVLAWYEVKGGYRNLFLEQISHTGSSSLETLTNGANQDYDPTVVMNPISGDFAITFQVGLGLNTTLAIGEFKANGTLIGALALGSNEFTASMSCDTNNDLLLTVSVQRSTNVPISSVGTFAHFA